MLQNTRINPEEVELLFQTIREEGVEPEGLHLWGFNFLAEAKGRLKQLGEKLLEQGFTLEPPEFSAELGAFLLVTYKMEAHTATSLNERNRSFHALAEKYEVAYDGPEVELQ